MNTKSLASLMVIIALFTGIVSAQDTVSSPCSAENLGATVNQSFETFDGRSQDVDSVAYLSNLRTLRDTLTELIDGCVENNRVDDGSAGTGTFTDPFRFGIVGSTGTGTSVKVTGILRPADAVIRGYNRYNDRPAAGQEYIILKADVFCDVGGDSSCDVSYSNFKLVGSKGVVYSYPYVSMDDHELDVEIFPGAQGSGDLPFLVDSSDTNLKLIYTSRFGSANDGVYFEAEPSRDSGVEITASRNVNIRSAPSTNAGVVGSLAPNTATLAFGRNQDATWVQTAVGWVFSDLIQTEGDLEQLPVTAE